MKTQEELISLKEEVETVSRKLNELTDEELEQVTGGFKIDVGDESGLIKTILDLFFKNR